MIAQAELTIDPKPKTFGKDLGFLTKIKANYSEDSDEGLESRNDQSKIKSGLRKTVGFSVAGIDDEAPTVRGSES